jgi:HPt (histidine-containing phosphotransfer) domain-containing protein
MKLEDHDSELRRLQEMNERVGANLVELEVDSSRRLLEASALTGESAARWSTASAALTDLWAWRGLLDGFLERAHELRKSPRRADELGALLGGPSIELSRSEVPLAERDLLGSSEVAVRCTADQLLERMSRAFDEVKVVVARFGEAWESLTPRLTSARAELDRAQALATQLGESGRSDLAKAAHRLAEVSASLSADPLSVAPKDVDRLIDSLESINRDLESTAALRGELDARLRDARAMLSSLEETVAQGRAAHEEALVKVSVPSAPPALALPADLGGDLDEIAALARSGAWRDARRRLERWTTDTRALLDDAERILRANRAPIEARNQLRSLLEAYQVKARRLGAIEDPELERICAQAHEALFTAPTDLAVVSQLVRRYQEMLSVPRPAGEALR